MILACNGLSLDTLQTENHLALKREVEERKLHKMATVDHILEMWHCSQNLHATQQDSHAQNK